ncbi:MAG: hypothetical protein ACRD3T_17005 [Terriglobia bacterium]
MLSTIMQWIHLSAAVVGVGGVAFLVVILFPAVRQAEPAQREALVRSVLKRFRWATWTVIVLLILSGVYNMSLVWEAPWGVYWKMLTLKIALALVVFLIALCLTVPLKTLNWFRVRREKWLAIALGLGMIVILISAYLRRG